MQKDLNRGPVWRRVAKSQRLTHCIILALSGAMMDTARRKKRKQVGKEKGRKKHLKRCLEVVGNVGISLDSIRMSGTGDFDDCGVYGGEFFEIHQKFVTETCDTNILWLFVGFESPVTTYMWHTKCSKWYSRSISYSQGSALKSGRYLPHLLISFFTGMQ